MVSSLPGHLNWTELYLVGSEAREHIMVVYRVEKSGQAFVTFTRLSDSVGTVDLSGAAVTGNCRYGNSVECPVPKPPDAIVVAGMGGEDEIVITGFEPTASPVFLGGEGKDQLEGGGQEDVLVDGNGIADDYLYAKGSDDALVNNEGVDKLEGGNGNDLLVSTAVCQGDTLQGAAGGVSDGTAQNNASWALLLGGSGGMVADLATQTAGTNFTSEKPVCPAGSMTTTLRNIDDLEGSTEDDSLFGDGNSNSLLGREGKDQLFTRAGEDFIEAIDGVHDALGGGADSDTCNYDKEIDSRESCEKGEAK